MSESMSGDKGKMDRRGFLKGLGALTAVTAIGATTETFAAQRESQESKLPSVDEIERKTRDTILDAKQNGQSPHEAEAAWGKWVFGGASFFAGMKAYDNFAEDLHAPKEPDNSILAILKPLEFHATIENDEIGLKQINGKLEEAGQMNTTAQVGYKGFLVARTRYYSLIIKALDSELAAQKTQENLEKIRKTVPDSLSMKDFDMGKSPEDTRAEAENLHSAVITLVRTNDQLLEMQAKYLQSKEH